MSELARLHLKWLLRAAEGLTDGLPDAAIPSLALSMSHLVGSALEAPLLFALNTALGDASSRAPPPMPPLTFHWPLDGTLRLGAHGPVPAAQYGAGIQPVLIDGLADPSISPSISEPAMRFVGRAVGASAVSSVPGLSEAALSVTVWVRIGAAAAPWVSL